MQSILDQIMKTPYLFIASCLEAAIYGGMELDVRHGTSSEMDSSLLKIIDEKRTTRTIVFCRSNEEITKLQDMLLTVYNIFSTLMIFIMLIRVVIRSALSPW